MPLKLTYIVASILGSLVGGYIPTLWGADYLSFSSIIGNGIGGLLGIYIAYKFLR